MTVADRLRAALVSAQANERFTEAVMRFRDGTALCFCHRVDERWARAVGRRPEDRDAGLAGLAGGFLAAITMFRLNAKHLDIQFDDGSRWDQAVPPSL